MSEPTIPEARQALEKAAAMFLGKMVFEFSRLDMNLGLCLVCTDDGRNLKALTEKFEEATFDKKLKALKQYVAHHLKPGSKKYSAYTEWIERAHGMRITRNQLVHGRWGVDPIRQQVINVLGLPTSPRQTERPYSLEELERILGELKSLQIRLSEIREQLPLTTENN